MNIEQKKERFFSYVKKSKNCWNWTGAKGSFGYGIFHIPDTSRGSIGSHRYSWQIHYGKIRNGLFVLHKCDNPPCVNPEHLWLGTPKQNTADAIKKGRLAKWEKHGNAKLTIKKVKKIRNLYIPNIFGATRLSKKFKVSKHTIQRIIWNHGWI